MIRIYQRKKVEEDRNMTPKLLRLSTLTFFSTISLYSIISKVIFDEIFLTSSSIVDEEFHLPLGEAYCKHDFYKWDPKVTTFPGLYLLSSLIFSWFGLCSTYWLRFVSFLSSIVNIVLFYLVFKSYNREVAWKTIISAVNLSILPPLYFFSHVYYTDVSSIMMTMLLLICVRKESHYLASFFGALAILMRQTNIIWMVMLFGDHLLKKIHMLSSENTKYLKQVKVSLKDVVHLIKTILIKPADILKKIDLQLIFDCLAHSLVIFSFLVFVYLNGSIVLGDKNAHEATIHLVQVFYFATFTLIFGWPHFLGSILPFIKFTWNNKILMVAAIALCLCTVHFNTLVHPYMLADNRHYVFYVWNRFYGKYHLFRYGMVLVYIFALYGILSKIWDHNDITYPLMYILCTVLVLVMQRMIEFRYYLFPYILFRMQIKKTTSTILALEFLTYLALNAFTLYIFFNKSIIWDTYDYPQRLMW